MARRLLSSALFVMLAIGVLPSRASAQGGPPLITDDPDTPGPGYWEINIAALLDRENGGRRMEMPRLDINYGVGRRIQLKFEVPWVRAWDRAGQSRIGAGNAEVGIKWRFLGQEGQRIAWSVYPQFEFNVAHS